jgi:hypothetical protein
MPSTKGYPRAIHLERFGEVASRGEQMEILTFAHLVVTPPATQDRIVHSPAPLATDMRGNLLMARDLSEMTQISYDDFTWTCTTSVEVIDSRGVWCAQHDSNMRLPGS